VLASPDRGRRAAASCRAAISCAVILIGAAACGAAHPGPSAPATPSANPLAGLTAGQITRKAVADLAAVSSVRITGSVVQDGQTDPVDLILGPRSCAVTEQIPGQGSIVMIVIGNTMWSRLDGQIGKKLDAMYPAKVRRYVAGKYLQEPDAAADLADLCGPDQFASTFGSPLKDLVKGKITTISGQPALQLADKRHTQIAYVTISARPEFLRLDVSGQENLDFAGYDRPVTVTPPPASETVTPAQLEELAGQAAG
jgi:hypothetical protein